MNFIECPIDGHQCSLPLCNEVPEDPTCTQVVEHLAASFIHLNGVETLIDPLAATTDESLVDTSDESLESITKAASALKVDRLTFLGYIKGMTLQVGRVFSVEVLPGSNEKT